VSCGGGGGDSGGENTNTSVEYDMWEYVVSNKTITKDFDKFDTDSNYNTISGPEINAGQLTEIIVSSDMVIYEEIANGTVIESETFIVSSDEIQVVDGYTLNRHRSLNSSFGENCIIENHYEYYSPVSGYDFHDVIQIKCGSYSQFYAKGIGLVVGQNYASFDDGQNITHYYSIGVANLQ
jgi:hypothetical protein